MMGEGGGGTLQGEQLEEGGGGEEDHPVPQRQSDFSLLAVNEYAGRKEAFCSFQPANVRLQGGHKRGRGGETKNSPRLFDSPSFG